MMTRVSIKKIKLSLSVALLATLIGCASNQGYAPTGQPSNSPQTQQPSPSSEGQTEEIIVTATRATSNSRSKYKRRRHSEKTAPQVSEHAYNDTDYNPHYSEEQLLILRKNSAQQIFKDYGVNPTISTAHEQHSTFAMDVDTVSYQLAKAGINSGRLPNKSSIRVEEFVNNFAYNYASNDDTLSISAEVVPSPYRPGFHLLHVGVKAKHVSEEQRLPANLVLVADVSGSMNSNDKMGLQKQALTTLVSQLDSRDSVAIVAYSDNAKVILRPTKASNKSKIYKAIRKMRIGGGTNVQQGLEQGYAMAEKMAYPGHVNRVVLTSDGLANIGYVDPKQILKRVGDYKRRNIFLTTVGVGRNMYNDFLLEQLANQGNGGYLYLANQNDIERVFVDGLTTQLQVVAKDAKVQLSFNPERVSLFRQIGYENRGLQKQDFLDAHKDGGEVGANQQVTVLYEIKLVNSNTNEDLANVALSYKKPQGSKVFTVDKPIPSSVIRSNNETSSSDTVVSMAVAAFAEKLRQSYWSRTYGYRDIELELKSLPRHVRNSEHIIELRNLVEQASELDSRHDPYAERYPLSRIDYDRVPLLR